MSEPPRKRRANSLHKAIDDITNENNVLYDEIDNLKQENTELKFEHESLLRPVGRITNERDALKQENHTLKQEADAMQTILARSQENDTIRDKTIAELYTSKGHLEQKICQLERKLKNPQAQSDHNNIPNLEMERQKAEFSKLKVTNATKSNVNTELTSRNKELERKYRDMEVEIKAPRDKDYNIELYKQEVDRLTSDISDLKKAASAKDEEISDLKTDYSYKVLKEERICIKTALDSARNETELLHREKNGLAEKIQALETDIQQLVDSANEAEIEPTNGRNAQSVQHDTPIEDGNNQVAIPTEIEQQRLTPQASVIILKIDWKRMVLSIARKELEKLIAYIVQSVGYWGVNDQAKILG
jgi:chromosome segregation ATPase